MLLYIYLGTTAYVWIDTIRHWRMMDKRLKEEGYVSTANKGIGFFDVVLCGMVVVALSLPVFNLLFPIINHDKDGSYDNYKNYLEEAGAIEKVALFEDTAVKEKENILTIKDTKLVERTNKDGHRYYSPMYCEKEIDDINQKRHVYIKKYK